MAAHDIQRTMALARLRRFSLLIVTLWMTIGWSPIALGQPLFLKGVFSELPDLLGRPMSIDRGTAGNNVITVGLPLSTDVRDELSQTLMESSIAFWRHWGEVNHYHVTFVTVSSRDADVLLSHDAVDVITAIQLNDSISQGSTFNRPANSSAVAIHGGRDHPLAQPQLAQHKYGSQSAVQTETSDRDQLSLLAGQVEPWQLVTLSAWEAVPTLSVLLLFGGLVYLGQLRSRDLAQQCIAEALVEAKHYASLEAKEPATISQGLQPTVPDIACCQKGNSQYYSVGSDRATVHNGNLVSLPPEPRELADRISIDPGSLCPENVVGHRDVFSLVKTGAVFAMANLQARKIINGQPNITWLLDRDRVAAITNHDRKLICSMLAFYIRIGSCCYEAIIAANNTGNLQEVKNLAGQIKGNVGTLGAEYLIELAQVIEFSIAQQQFVNLHRKIDSLIISLAHLLQEIRQWRDELTGKMSI